MVNIIRGTTHKSASDALVRFFYTNQYLEGQFYIGYPILFAAGESTTIDALWISEEYGVVIFDIVDGTELKDRGQIQDELYGIVESQLTAYPALKDGRKLAVNIDVITFSPAAHKDDPIKFKNASNPIQLSLVISGLKKWEYKHLYEEVVSIIQSVVNLKVKNKRENVKRENSRGAKLKKIESAIATLDRDQEKAVIEFHNGIQRIRGLAGSGKTIVLALKAAYLHAEHPEWNIAVTFNTRALKNQFKDLISRFCIEKKRELPDWTKIKVINAWGKPRDNENDKGLYLEACINHNVTYYDFRAAENLAVSLGKKPQQAFESVCDVWLNEVKKPIQKYDAILVDEAQDLTSSFLNLCFKLLKEPKRLIYAYDELQKLNEGTSLKSPKGMLGREASDTILKKCYRNPKPILVTAHALGFGVYRVNNSDNINLVQFFDQPQLWREVGYDVKEGELRAGQKVTLSRGSDSSPTYLEEHSDINDLIIFHHFNSVEDQASWVAKQIEDNLTKDELLHKDILVINPIALTTEREVSLIRSLLFNKGVNTHIAGKIDADVFFEDASVTFTGINRAKGNEVPMVYIINSHDCYANPFEENYDLIKRRNILFTAITRSKAWVRVCGVGPRMKKLVAEYESVKGANFELRFTYPTDEQIKTLNIIHRDMSESEKQSIKQDETIMDDLMEIVSKIKRGETHLEDYSIKKQSLLRKLLG